MPLAACARCKKMFAKALSPVCPKCQEEEDSDVSKIRKVIEEEPNLNAEELAERAEVDVSVVNRMIDGGQLTSVSMILESVQCGRCGQPAISVSKKLCQACLDKLNAEVAQAQARIQLGIKKAPEIGSYNMNVRRTLDSKRK